jgi:hypothetical protein
MTSKCTKCGGECVPYVVDPDMVEDFCPICDKNIIPKGAEISSLYCFEHLMKKKVS